MAFLYYLAGLSFIFYIIYIFMRKHKIRILTCAEFKFALKVRFGLNYSGTAFYNLFAFCFKFSKPVNSCGGIDSVCPKV